MRILIYGDSNSWGYLDDGSGARHPPLYCGQQVTASRGMSRVIEECLPGRTSNVDDPQEGAVFNGAPHRLPPSFSRTSRSTGS